MRIDTLVVRTHCLPTHLLRKTQKILWQKKNKKQQKNGRVLAVVVGCRVSLCLVAGEA